MRLPIKHKGKVELKAAPFMLVVTGLQEAENELATKFR